MSNDTRIYDDNGNRITQADWDALTSKLDRYQTLLGAAYQLAGLVDAPERFLDAFSATMGYKGDADKLLPVTLDEIGVVQRPRSSTGESK